MNAKNTLGLLALAMLALMAMSPTVAAANIAADVTGDDATVGVTTTYGTAEVDADTNLLPMQSASGSAFRQAIKVCVHDTQQGCGADGFLWATAEGPWGCISTWFKDPTDGC